MIRIPPRLLLVASLAAWLGLASSAHARYLPSVPVDNAATTSDNSIPVAAGWTPYHSEFSAVSGYLANTLSGLGTMEEPKTQSGALPSADPGDSSTSPNPARDYLRSLQRANANADVQGGGMSNTSSSPERPPVPQTGTCEQIDLSACELVAFLVAENKSLNIPTVVSTLFHPPRSDAVPSQA